MSEVEDEQDKPWWAAGRFIISAIAVGLLLVLGIILAVAVWTEDEPSAARSGKQPPPSASASPTAETDAATSASICGLSAAGGKTLTSPPENVEWVYLGGIAAPKSQKHGPGRIDEKTGLRSCYSHTPEGALLAFAGFLAASGDLELMQTTMEAMVLPGPGKEKALNTIEEDLEDGQEAAPPLEIAGYRLLSYTGEKATMEIVTSADSGEGEVYVTTSAFMVWHNGDWHIKIGKDGSGGPVSGQVSDLSGYIKWGPGNG